MAARACRSTAGGHVRIASGEYQAWPPRLVCRTPACDGFLAEPQRQAAALAWARIIGGPVAHLVRLLGDVMAMRGVGLERHGGNLGSKEGSSVLGPCHNTARAASGIAACAVEAPLQAVYQHFCAFRPSVSCSK